MRDLKYGTKRPNTVYSHNYIHAYSITWYLFTYMKDAATSCPCVKMNVGSLHYSIIPNRSQMEAIFGLFPEIHKYAWQLINSELRISKKYQLTECWKECLLFFFLSFYLFGLNIEFIPLLQPIAGEQARFVALCSATLDISDFIYINFT